MAAKEKMDIFFTKSVYTGDKKMAKSRAVWPSI
jgi:hypothetical protein